THCDRILAQLHPLPTRRSSDLPLDLRGIHLTEGLAQLRELVLQIRREDLLVDLFQLPEPFLERGILEPSLTHGTLERLGPRPHLLDPGDQRLLTLEELPGFLQRPVLHAGALR